MSENGKTTVSRMIDGISGIFMPLVNLLSAAGILKGIVAVLSAAGVLASDSGTYLVLHSMADSLFYFLPMMLAVTSAKKFGANPFTCAVIAGMLLHPALTEAFGKEAVIHFIGVPLKSVTYHSSVIPMILAAGLLTFTERFLERLLPEMVRGFLTPLLCIIIVGFAALSVFGPFGAMVGDVLAAGYERIYHFSPVAAGILLGAALQPMVIFGFHWSLILIAMNNVALTGHDTVLTFMAPSVFAQAGAALAVMLKSKEKTFQSVCASSAVSALFGITEPAMFSVNLPRKKPMLAVCIGGAAGGAIVGLSGAEAMAFAFPSLVSLPVFLGRGFGLYLIGCFTGFEAAFVLTMLMKWDEK